jgi:thioredoxin 2
VASSVVTCPNCGKKNRIGSSSSGVPRCGNCHEPLPWIVDTDQAGFDADIAASVPVLVDFWAPWCGPCRMVTPAVEAQAREHAGKLKVVKLNVDEAPEVSARFSVQGIPLLVLFQDGQEVDRQVGAVPESTLRKWLEPHLEAPSRSAA